MQRILLVLVVLLVVPAGEAMADRNSKRGFYLGLQGGINRLEPIDIGGSDIEFETGVAVGAAVGYDAKWFRLETEITHRKNDVDDSRSFGFGTPAEGDVTATSVMFNGYFDFKNRSPFTPYGGAGLGLANVSFNDVSTPYVYLDDSVLVTSYQLALGLGIDLVEERVLLDLGYRLFTTSEIEFENSFGYTVAEDHYVSQTLLATLRIMF